MNIRQLIEAKTCPKWCPLLKKRKSDEEILEVLINAKRSYKLTNSKIDKTKVEILQWVLEQEAL